MTRSVKKHAETIKANPARPWQWIVKVYDDPETTVAERRVASVLIMSAWSKDGSNCYPGLDLIQRRTKMRRDSITTALKNLQSKGYLILVRQGSKRSGKHTEYQLSLPIDESSPAELIGTDESSQIKGESSPGGSKNPAWDTPTPLKLQGENSKEGLADAGGPASSSIPEAWKPYPRGRSEHAVWVHDNYERWSALVWPDRPEVARRQIELAISTDTPGEIREQMEVEMDRAKYPEATR